MEGPVYLYYALTRFYTNHRSFFTSKSWAQLRNASNWENNISKCSGMDTVEKIFDFDKSKYKSYGGKDLKGNDTAIPCGLLPKHAFLDKYKLSNTTVSNIEIKEDNLANKYDKEYAFVSVANAKDRAWLDVTNGKFVYFK
jgi:hypothetical protein